MIGGADLPRRYEPRRTYWDVALVVAVFAGVSIAFSVASGEVTRIAVVVWWLFGVVMAILSEISYRGSNYLILHPDRVDISRRAWGPKQTHHKWGIPYHDIESVHVDSEKTGISVSFKKSTWNDARLRPDDPPRPEATPHPLGGRRPRPLKRPRFGRRDLAAWFDETESPASVRLRSISDLYAVADHLNAARDVQKQPLGG